MARSENNWVRKPLVAVQCKSIEQADRPRPHELGSLFIKPYNDDLIFTGLAVARVRDKLRAGAEFQHQANSASVRVRVSRSMTLGERVRAQEDRSSVSDIVPQV